MPRILKNARAIDAYYNYHYCSEHRKYLTPQRAMAEALCLVKWLGRIPATVCDVGCGDGRHLVAFRTLGVTSGFGFDRAHELTRKAKRNLSMDKDFIIRQLCFSQWQPKRETFDITYSLFSSFSYCLTRESAQRVIANMVHATKRGGLVCIDVDNRARLMRFLSGKLKNNMPVNDELHFDQRTNILSAKEKRRGVILETRMRYYTVSDFLALFAPTGIRRQDIIFRGGLQNEPFSSQSKRLIVVVKKRKTASSVR